MNKALQFDTLLARSKEILHKNDAGGYTVPTKDGLYPAQWNWDSAFVSLAFAYMGEWERGWKEVEMLLDAQWQNGMVPHIVFHGDDSGYFPNSKVWQAGERIPSSGISQPPVLSTFVRRIIEREGSTDTEYAKLKAVFPKLMNYHRWYHTTRNHNDLVKIIHPWESGFDNNQSYDIPLYNVPLDTLTPYERKDITHAKKSNRPHDSDYDHYIALLQIFREHNYDAQWCADNSPFQITDIGVNAMLLRADIDLLALATRLQEEQCIIELQQWIERLRSALHNQWNPELSLYTPFDICSNTPIIMPSITGMVPLFGLPDCPPKHVQAMTRVLLQWMDAVHYGLPCFDPRHPLFEPDRYCRGPAWPVWTWLVCEGLKANGNHELSRHIIEKTLVLLQDFDFYEFFNPLSGMGGGGSEFSWSAAMTIFFIRELKGAVLDPH